MEKAELSPLQNPKKKSLRKVDSWTDDDECSLADKKATKNFAAIGNGAPRNRSLYQLLIFETVLECLRNTPRKTRGLELC